MKLSRNWLSEYVNLTDKDLFTTLSLHTAEVEEEIQIGNIKNIVIGKVQELTQHPDADKLRVATVDTGKHGIRQIVCGAKNLEVGQTVPVAIPGAIMPGDFEIKEATLRGVLSQGMICSEDELGLTQERQPGIMVLSDDLIAGQDFGAATGFADSILEIENKSITNRPDLFGHYGIARECSVLWNTPLQPYLNEVISIPEGLPVIPVTIEDPTTCSRYMALRIDNVTAKPSPAWLKQRLQSVGQQSINAIVDITNYVMQDLGQPMHAFDASDINGSIQVGYSSHKEELFESLDGTERSITGDMVLIKNNDLPLAIAGVIGGAKSAISETTTSILLEVACFDTQGIRKTQKQLGLRTEASIRFEKGLDPEQCPLAMQKALALLQKVFPEMSISSSLTDIYPAPKERTVITTSYEFIRKRIGKSIAAEEVKRILTALGLQIQEIATEKINVTVPSWRDTGDISIPEDLVEEVVRIYGYNNIKSSLPLMPMNKSNNHAMHEEISKISNILSMNCHLQEVYNYSFYSKDLHQGLLLQDNHPSPIQVLNPLSEEQEVLRTSLVPQLARHAARVDIHSLPYGIYEIERVHLKQREQILENNLSHEPKRISIALATHLSTHSTEKELWEKHPFYHLKHVVTTLVQKYTGQRVEYKALSAEHKVTHPYLHPGKSADVYINSTYIGSIGELHPLANNYLKVKERTIVVAELEFIPLYHAITAKVLQPFSSLPEIGRDVTCTIDLGMPVGPILSHILHFDIMITDVRLVDLYQGERIPGKKSVSFHITFAHPTDTLTDKAIGIITSKLFHSLIKEFQCEIAGFSA